MSEKLSWILTDERSRSSVDSFRLSNKDLELTGSPPWSIEKQTLRGGLADGVEIIEVIAGELRLAILPTRGMGIWRASVAGTALGWKSPIQGPVHPKFVRLADEGGLGWLAGFDEWIVRCGLHSNGPPGKDILRREDGSSRGYDLTLHGKIANIPAHSVIVHVQQTPPFEIEITGVVDEAMLFFPALRLTTSIRVTPGQKGFKIADRVTNLASQPAELEMLYHCNFGPPLLGAGAQFVAPVESVSPRDAAAVGAMERYDQFPGPTPGIAEEVFFLDLVADSRSGRTVAALVDPHKKRACAIRYLKEQLPCFTLWRNPAAEQDGYVAGLEPGTNLPNFKSFEREAGRVVTLPSGGQYDIEMAFEVADTAEGVSALLEEIEALQLRVAPAIHPRPVKGLSSAAE